MGMPCKQTFYLVLPHERRQVATRRFVDAVIESRIRLFFLHEERRHMHEHYHPLTFMRGQVRLQPRLLRIRLRQGTVHDLGVQHDKMDSLMIETVPRPAELLVVQVEGFRRDPLGKHGRIRFVADVHVPGDVIRANIELFELLAGPTAGCRLLRSGGILFGQIAQMNDEISIQ